jgi:hypothetical protein
LESSDPMSDENTLRKSACEAIQAGKLPNRAPTHVWGGQGVGARCTICDRPIGHDEVEFELQFAGDGGSGPDNLHVHPRCFAAWELEREDAEVAASNRLLPVASREQMMPARECDPQNKRRPA